MAKNNQKQIIEQMVKDKKVRTAITRQSHYWFFHFYFNEYIRYQTAAFQREIFELSENEEVKNLVIVAFRGSAKSTIMTMSYPIWAILGKPQKKFVLILGLTQRQAKQHLLNLKYELERNTLLKGDLGPFEEDEEWASYSLVIPRYNARLTAASCEQSIRGIRHRSRRPDLIICDDIEDLASVKNRESRDKVHQWLTGEVIPAGDERTDLVIVGNLLHEDSLLMRLKNAIRDKRLSGVFKEYPLLNSKGQPLWPGRFKSLSDIEKLKKTIANEQSWQREYMLRNMSNEDRIVLPEWIKYYDKLPDDTKPDVKLRMVVSAVDLAISEKNTADYTAIISAKVYGWGEDMRIYILPYPINERLNFPNALKKIKQVSENLGNENQRTPMYIEDVAYQRSIIQQLQKENYPAEGISVAGQDKLARLNASTPAIKNGAVLFPKVGADILIGQLINFGKEKHDDLADAFSLLINKIVAGNKKRIKWPDYLDDGEKPICAGIMDKVF